MAIIGKNAIENLTTAMYEDLRVIYREYIQNSADSIDKAIQEGLLTADEARIEIEIDTKNSYISVTDNGIGIKCADFKRIMSSIADSTKDRTEDKGFRGIGRLGGISSCDILRFSCSVQGEETVSICTWNARQVREILVDKNLNPTAAELVDMVTAYTSEENTLESHFFKVELIGIEKSSNELLEEKKVNEYLCTVAPIPYETGFIFKSKIKEFANEHKFSIDEYQVFVNGKRIFKPYTTKLYELKNNSNKQAYDELRDIAFEIFSDDQGNILAWMWYGISKFEKQIPVINKMRGIRLRKSNIQIGNENTFSTHGFYKETRGGLYFVGEVFAISSDLIPNARRDYFNLNDTCREFESQLKPMFYDRFNTIYHYANTYKKALQKQLELQTSQRDFEEKLKSGNFVNVKEKEEAIKNIENQKKAAEDATKKIEVRDQKEQGDEVLSKVYNALRMEYAPQKVKKPLEISEKELDKTQKNKMYMTQALSKYNKHDQKLISRIYSILKTILPNDTAVLVISKIQEELSK